MNEPLRADAARNRDRLIEVARRHVQAGEDLPPLAVLAREAGVGTGTVYRHFPTVTVLLAALGEAGMRSVVEATRRAAEDEDAARGFAEVVGFVIRGQCLDPGIAAMLDFDEGRAPQPLVAELSGLVEKVLTRARAAGAVRSELTGDDVRRFVVGVAHALRMEPPLSEGAIDRYVAVLVDGLRAPRQAG